MTFHDGRALAPPLLDELLAFSARFVDADRNYLARQFARHAYLVAFRSGGRLVGTVSVDIYPFEHEGRALTVIFTSSTILDDSVRGGKLIQRAGVASYLRGLARAPLRPVYWLFDTFSYKSYLLLARNFVEYWPRGDAATPPATTRLIARLAEDRYGAAWQPERGIVARSPHKRLKEWVAPIPDQLRGDPDVAFFAQRNPGHREGDMLVCLAPLSLANWGRIVARALLPRARPSRR
jgi:hypothetical protein